MTVIRNNAIEIEKILKNNKPIFLFLYLNGCFHCENTKPEWNKLIQHPKNNVILADLEASNINNKINELLKKEINGFPTFLLFKNNECIEFNEERTENGFNQFINKHCPSLKQKTLKGGRRFKKFKKTRKNKNKNKCNSCDECIIS